jgi:GT2 family glycosyltransferase
MERFSRGTAGLDGVGILVNGALIAVVIIGRNEGERLLASLQSVLHAGVPLIYADSGSGDGSVDLARRLGVQTIELDPSRPFSAARGRNEGLAEAVRTWPNVKYILFLDGDCTLDAEFPAAAAEKLEDDPKLAIVTGHLSERSPQSSIYNRMCAIEWRGSPGPIENMNGLGGIMAVRVSAFQEVGGFNEQAISGEEADLGVRLRLRGYSVTKIDHPMAIHDAQMYSFRQWWTRAVRNGHSLAHRYASHGRTPFRDGLAGLRSAVFWGFLLPLSVLLLIWPTRGFSLLLLGGYGLLGWRIYRHYVREGHGTSDAVLMARFLIYAKFAEFLGVVRYCVNRTRGRFHIIEWK